MTHDARSVADEAPVDYLDALSVPEEARTEADEAWTEAVEAWTATVEAWTEADEMHPRPGILLTENGLLADCRR